MIESVKQVEKVYQKNVLVPYRQSRLEYISSIVLSSMLIGRSVKDQEKCVTQSLKYAKELMKAIDAENS